MDIDELEIEPYPMPIDYATVSRRDDNNLKVIVSCVPKMHNIL